MSRSWARWTDDEDDVLVIRLGAETPEAVAAALDRTPLAVVARASHLGLERPRLAGRTRLLTVLTDLTPDEIEVVDRMRMDGWGAVEIEARIRYGRRIGGRT